MNFDFGEVLSRAWKITWEHKVLWIIGILFGFFVALMFPLMLSFLLPLWALKSGMDSTLVFVLLGAILLVFFLFILILQLVSVFAQTSLTLGVLNAEQENERLSVAELIKRSLPFFWRVLGLMLLFALGMLAVNLAIQAVVFLLAILTFGVGSMRITPLMMLYYPFLYAAVIWEEQALNGIIIDRLTIMNAARQGWHLLRNNVLPVAIMALIIYFGIGMITGIVLMPVMMPFFILPFGFITQDLNWMIIAISILSFVVFIPLFAVLSGWSMIFTKSAWVLTYLRLTQKPQLQSLS